MTREEAIEIVRNIYQTDAEKDALAVLIPELRESEDEKIIEGFYTLIRGIRRDGGLTLNKVPLDKCETWLEKQKESKPEVKDPFDDEQFRRGYDAGKNDAMRMPEMVLYRRSWYMEGYHDREFNMEPKWTVKAEKGGPRYYENPNYGKPLEQKDQKPAEWNGPKEFISDTISMRLKSLHAQPKQEWSEEDEQHLKWLCRIIHSRKNHGELSLAEESELGNWIDKWINHNPQPHWMPSEEQMKALKRAVNKLANSDVADSVRLSIMYDNLKKLM